MEGDDELSSDVEDGVGEEEDECEDGDVEDIGLLVGSGVSALGNISWPGDDTGDVTGGSDDEEKEVGRRTVRIWRISQYSSPIVGRPNNHINKVNFINE